jgi:hypothetical protein
MKIVLPLLLALATTVAARADIVLEQKAEGPMLNARMTLKVKGDFARTDTVSANSNMTILMDLKAERMMVIVHEKKLIMQKDMKAARQQMEAAQRAAGLDPSMVGKPRATGTMEKVGDWNAEIYEFNLGNLLGKIWVAKDFPNGQAMREELKKVTAANNGGFDPNKLDVPGMIVKYQLHTQAGLITSTLIKATEEPVSDAEFVLPRGYSEMAMPPVPLQTPK